jgi:imidazolonepropionase-like amidohydrolase
MLHKIARLAVVVLCLLTTCLPGGRADEASRGSVTLFQNVRVFNGRDLDLSPPCHVLVRGNKIEKISTDPIPTDRRGDTQLIDGGGRTLMPGLIDAHTHLMMSTVPLGRLMTSDMSYVSLAAGKGATEMLMRGFTTARDLGGPTFGLKRAIDEGVIPGPRIWPAGAMVSQTSGHGDFRSLHDLPWMPDDMHFTERLGFAAIADGPDEVLRRVREQLMHGASHIKLMAGGGVSSFYDPLDVTQYTEAELKAAVEAAEAWGTYVTVHAYTPKAVQMAVRSGVRCIDHGQMVDEETVLLMKEHEVWWSLQPFLDDEDATPFPEGSPNRAKQMQMVLGTNQAYELAKKHRIKTAFGTDNLFDPKLATRQGSQLAKLTRWYTPAEALAMATGANGELLALSGLRAPYPGKLGVVEEGALADLLLVDGDPTADISLIENPEEKFVVIMKDGRVYKNLLAR